MTVATSLTLIMLAFGLPDLEADGTVNLTITKFKIPDGEPLCDFAITQGSCFHQWSISILQPGKSLIMKYQTDKVSARREVDGMHENSSISISLVTEFEVVVALNDSSISNALPDGLRYVINLPYPHEMKWSEIFFDYRMMGVCNPGYYRPLCDKYCTPRDDSEGHYTCDDSGEKICLPAWTNLADNCTTDICSTDPCLNNGSCSIVDKRMHCQCHEPAYGRNCEICRVYLNDAGECRPIAPAGEAVGQVTKISLAVFYIIIGVSAVITIMRVVHRQDKEAEEDTTDCDTTETVEGFCIRKKSLYSDTTSINQQ